MSKYWTVTLNNYSDEDYENWKTKVDNGEASYICFQKEVAPTTGTSHLQGYVVLLKRTRLSGLKKVLGQSVHAVLSNGTPSQNRAYCEKSISAVANSFYEAGGLPPDSKRGKRTDFEAFQNAVEEGLRCKKKARTLFPDVVAKYPRWCYDLLADQTDIQVEDHVLYPWQEALKDDLAKPGDDRTITFVVDKDGNQGKTWFAKWYTKKHDDAQFLEPSKKADMAYAL